ncbi:MAG: hypothetical protein E6Q97_10870 [Desulfurellales bacterium]|nr:MAG: hypothetical protein E6Q97_10870 [Desulfurellales bacterium]
MQLPRYVVARQRPQGTVYYWQVPARLRVTSGDHTWPVGVIRLPDDPVEMLSRASELNAELDYLRNGITTIAPRGSLPWLITQYEQSSYFAELRDKTKRSYTQLSKYVVKWSREKNNPPVAGLTPQKILEFLAQFEKRKSLRDHVATYLAIVLEYGRRNGVIADNPARRLGLKRAKRLKPIRAVTVDQLLTIVAKAGEMGLPHVALGTLLHFDLGQRQGDILALQKPRDYRDGVFHFRQSKTDQEVTIRPFLRETREALDALPSDRFMLVADANGQAVNTELYVRQFRQVAKACGFHDLWEMEMRHSCVIYMEQAGLTPAEIATRTGHKLSSVIMILENYRYRDPVVAAQGAIKLEAYRNKSATKV